MRNRLPVIVLLLGAAACAEVGRPPGGPVDDVPPELGTVTPGSLATSVAGDAELVFEFSERIDRRRFARSLVLVPDVALEGFSFDGTSVRVAPDGHWPADTAVVWVLLPSLPDKHGVSMAMGHTGAFTTADALPPGVIRGHASLDSLVELPHDGVDWSTLRVRLTLEPEEGGRQRRPWRFADGSSDGSFELSWLDLPSGPFRLQAWLDRNGDATRGEREPVATLDSLFVGEADSMLEIESSLLRLVDLEGPVPVEFCLDSVAIDSVSVVLWTWPEEATELARSKVDSTGCLELSLVPGATRWGAWLDLDGDFAWSRMEDGSSEPFVAVDTLRIEPATPVRVRMQWPRTRVPFDGIDSLRTVPVPREARSASSSS